MRNKKRGREIWKSQLGGPEKEDTLRDSVLRTTDKSLHCPSLVVGPWLCWWGGIQGRWQHINWLQAYCQKYRAGHMFGVKMIWREVGARIIPSSFFILSTFSVKLSLTMEKIWLRGQLNFLIFWEKYKTRNHCSRDLKWREMLSRQHEKRWPAQPCYWSELGCMQRGRECSVGGLAVATSFFLLY